ncbi:MAG TPA: VOC family protein [Gemmatimonadales bacterium]|nr:VOC family protein [Gemmatimonadales bacterium]
MRAQHLFSVQGLHQVAIPAADLDRSVTFYRDKLGATFIAAFPVPGLAFFQLGDARLLIDKAAHASGSLKPGGSVLYFRVADIQSAYQALRDRGVQFDAPPHLIHRDDSGTFGPAGSSEWMAFFRDPDGNLLALAARVLEEPAA